MRRAAIAACVWVAGASFVGGTAAQQPAAAADPAGEPSRPVPLADAPPPPPPLPAPAAGAPEDRSPQAASEPAPQRASEPASAWPDISVRLDPFNWLVHGQLRFEAEVAVWRFLSAELDMILVVNDEPALLHYRGRPEALRRKSNGAGALAGFGLGVGAWLLGTPFQGPVLRLYYDNVGLSYQSVDQFDFVFDRTTQAERRLGLLIGSHSRFGHFTIGGGVGMEYEINSQTRCFANDTVNDPRSSGCPNDREQLIALDPALNATADLNGRLHPVYFVMRLSVGAVF